MFSYYRTPGTLRVRRARYEQTVVISQSVAGWAISALLRLNGYGGTDDLGSLRLDEVYRACCFLRRKQLLYSTPVVGHGDLQRGVFFARARGKRVISNAMLPSPGSFSPFVHQL